LFIGSQNSGTGFMNGSIDEVKFFDKILTETQIANLYNYGSVEGAPAPPTVDTINISETNPTENYIFNVNTINLNATRELFKPFTYKLFTLY